MYSSIPNQHNIYINYIFHTPRNISQTHTQSLSTSSPPPALFPLSLSFNHHHHHNSLIFRIFFSFSFNAGRGCFLISIVSTPLSNFTSVLSVTTFEGRGKIRLKLSKVLIGKGNRMCVYGICMCVMCVCVSERGREGESDREGGGRKREKK